MVQRCLATLLQMFCTIRGSLSDVLFTARNNDIFIPVQKAATHEAVKLKNYDWKLFKQLQVFLVDVQTH